MGCAVSSEREDKRRMLKALKQLREHEDSYAQSQSHANEDEDVRDSPEMSGAPQLLTERRESLGNVCSESPRLLALKTKAIVVKANVFNGINADPDQFRDEQEREDERMARHHNFDAVYEYVDNHIQAVFLAELAEEMEQEISMLPEHERSSESLLHRSPTGSPKAQSHSPPHSPQSGGNSSPPPTAAAKESSSSPKDTSVGNPPVDFPLPPSPQQFVLVLNQPEDATDQQVEECLTPMAASAELDPCAVPDPDAPPHVMAHLSATSPTNAHSLRIPSIHSESAALDPRKRTAPPSPMQLTPRNDNEARDKDNSYSPGEAPIPAWNVNSNHSSGKSLLSTPGSQKEKPKRTLSMEPDPKYALGPCTLRQQISFSRVTECLRLHHELDELPRTLRAFSTSCTTDASSPKSVSMSRKSSPQGAVEFPAATLSTSSLDSPRLLNASISQEALAATMQSSLGGPNFSSPNSSVGSPRLHTLSLSNSPRMQSLGVSVTSAPDTAKAPLYYTHQSSSHMLNSSSSFSTLNSSTTDFRRTDSKVEPNSLPLTDLSLARLQGHLRAKEKLMTMDSCAAFPARRSNNNSTSTLSGIGSPKRRQQAGLTLGFLLQGRPRRRSTEPSVAFL